MRKQTIRLFLLFAAMTVAAVLFWPNQSDSSPKEAETALPADQITTVRPGKAQSSHRFVALGDWGAGTSFQKSIAGQLCAEYEKAPYDTVLMLGDNIYEVGDVNKLGKAYFTDMYAPLISQNVRFIVALGNHDIVAGFQDDQVRFFKMPGYYYNNTRGPFEFFVINTNAFAKDEVQQQWLERALKNSTAEWKIVMGHHPIYSSGEHGINRGLQDTLEPLLVKFRVPLYLAGHDHDYERFTPIKGVQHIVSGGGGAYLRGFPKVAPHSVVRLKTHHFLSFTADGVTLKMQVIDKTGQMIDAAQWRKASELPGGKRGAKLL